MSTSHMPSPPTYRHTSRALAVTRSMTSLREALPFVRALVLAGFVTALIMIGLPAVLTIAAATP